jgi:hypothetical protein
MVADEIRQMTGSAALPRLNGELTFEAPWQGRVFGLAVGVTSRLGLDWESFRGRLIDAIDAIPERPYYESWLAALESLVTEHTTVSGTELARRSGEPVVRNEPGMGTLELFDVATDESTLFAILTDMFERWWPVIRFGTLIQGAVYEIRLREAPRSITMLDGYVTVDLGDWHFHLCIGEHRGIPGDGVEPGVARHRRCARAELYRLVFEGAPVSWGFRMFNGAGEQQLTVMLPNPFLDDDHHELPGADWSRLACWDHLRERFLGLEPDLRDRSAPAFHHG